MIEHGQHLYTYGRCHRSHIRFVVEKRTAALLPTGFAIVPLGWFSLLRVKFVPAVAALRPVTATVCWSGETRAIHTLSFFDKKPQFPWVENCGNGWLFVQKSTNGKRTQRIKRIIGKATAHDVLLHIGVRTVHLHSNGIVLCAFSISRHQLLVNGQR